MKKYKIIKSILKSLKEKVERFSNNDFRLNLYLYKEGKHQCFDVFGEIFEDGLFKNTETFSLICCEFCHKEVESPLLTLRIGISTSLLTKNNNLSEENKIRFNEVVFLKDKNSWERNLSSFGLAVKNTILKDLSEKDLRKK